MATQILFQTANSALLERDVQHLSKLVEDCVRDVADKLEERPQIIVYGKVCRQNRNVGFFSNESGGYFYSGNIADAKPLTPNLEQLLDEINKMYSSQFNGILVNYYANGDDCIGRHADDETGLDSTAGVVALSYGATRKFRIRHKDGSEFVSGKGFLDFPTKSMHLLQMAGVFQREFTHEIPKEKSVKTARFSFTFRRHIR